MKPCTKCRREKPPSEFRGLAKAQDGLTWWCRDCLAAATKQARLRRISHYREVNRQNMREKTGWQGAEYRRWTTEDVEFLIEMWGGRMGRVAIANLLRRTVEACTRRAWLLGLRLNGEDWRQERDREEAA